MCFVGSESVAGDTDTFDGYAGPGAKEEVMKDATGGCDDGVIKDLDFFAAAKSVEAENGCGESEKL